MPRDGGREGGRAGGRGRGGEGGAHARRADMSTRRALQRSGRHTEARGHMFSGVFQRFPAFSGVKRHHTAQTCTVAVCSTAREIQLPARFGNAPAPLATPVRSKPSYTRNRDKVKLLYQGYQGYSTGFNALAYKRATRLARAVSDVPCLSGCE